MRLEEEYKGYQDQGAEEFAKTEEQLISLARSIPVTPTIQQLIRDLEIMEQETQVVVQSIRFEEGEEGAQASWLESLLEQHVQASSQQTFEKIGNIVLSTVQFDIELKGTMKETLEFIKRYNELPRTIRIDQINFNGQLSNDLAALNDAEEITSTLKLTAYYVGQFAPYLDSEIPLGKDNALKLEDLYSLEQHLEQLLVASNSLVLNLETKQQDKHRDPQQHTTSATERAQRLSHLAKPHVFQLIQYGSYSNTSILDRIVRQLEEEGYAPRVYAGGLNNLYLAAAADQHTASGWQEWLLEQQKEGYVKQIHYDLDSLQQKELINLLTVGGTLFELLSQQAFALVMHQEQHVPQITNSLPDERIALLLQDYQAYYELALVKDVESQREQINLLYTSLSKANEKLDDYRYSQKAEDLLQLQGYLLDYILTVYDLTR